MRKLLTILFLVICLSGCTSNKHNITNNNSIEGQAVSKSKTSTISPLEVDEEPVDSKISISKDDAMFTINGETGLDKFIFEENGMLRFPSGRVTEVSYLLPGYKKVVVDKDVFHENIEKIFVFLTKTESNPGEIPYSPLDGAGLEIYYTHNNQKTKIKLLTSYDMKTVYASFDTEDSLNYDSKVVSSEELSQIIHQLSGWKTFDTANLKEIDSMSIQIIDGVQASDLVVTLSGVQARNLLDRMGNSAEIIDWNNGAYNILVKLYKGEVLTYNAYLSGDSSPTIGIESQFFQIDSEVLREIYIELNYDMSVS